MSQRIKIYKFKFLNLNFKIEPVKDNNPKPAIQTENIVNIIDSDFKIRINEIFMMNSVELNCLDFIELKSVGDKKTS